MNGALDRCIEDTYNEGYHMGFSRGKLKGIDIGRENLARKIMEYINSNKHGSTEYFIVDKIEEICKECL